MKKIYLLLYLFLVLGITQISAQNDDIKRFYGGVSMDYLNISPEMYSYSSQNWIDDEGFGWYDWADEEIKEFNDYVSTEQTWMAPSLMFGMKILDNPESPWLLTGDVKLGYLFHKHNEIDNNTGVDLLEVKNDGKLNLFSSLNFNLKYTLQKWNLAINPIFNFGLNQSENISYNYLPEGNSDIKYNMQSLLYYPKVNLTGGYSFGDLSIYAGAGFGAYYTKQNLEISQATIHQTFKDEIAIGFKGKSNVNAVVGLDWLFADKFLLKIKTEIGIGIMGQGSLSILF